MASGLRFSEAGPCAAYRSRHDEPPDGAEVNDDDSTVVLSVWQYFGSGYLNPGDMLLAAGVEGSLQAAREALLDRRRGPALTSAQRAL